MSIGKIYRNVGEEISPKIDGYLYNKFLGDAIFDDITFALKGANLISITGFKGILNGRDFIVYDTDVNVILGSSATPTEFRIKLQLNISSHTINYVYESYPFGNLVQEDLNTTGNIYEVEIARYMATDVNVIEINKTISIYKDVNKSISEIEKKQEVKNYTLLASNWSGSMPYFQTITIADMLSTSEPIIEIVNQYTNTEEKDVEVAEWVKVSKIDSINGGIQFECFEEIPTIDLIVRVRGV